MNARDLVDEALSEIAAPAGVDLKAGVMAAWDERARRQAATTESDSIVTVSARGPWLLFFPGPLVAVAAALVFLATALIVWQQAREPRRVDRPARGQATQAAPPSTVVSPPPGVTSAPEPDVSLSLEREAARGESHTARLRVARRASRPLVEVEFPVEPVAANVEYLPGAPAGELGGDIVPMPRTPSILTAPLQPAPFVSEMSRPVSDFPADDTSREPGAVEGEPGQSGGPRR